MSLVDLFKKGAKAVKKGLHKALFQVEPELFVADFDVPAGLAVPPAVFRQFSDFVQYLEETKAGQRHLLTFWKDEAAYNAVATQFQAACGLAAGPARKTTTHGPDEPRWRLDGAKVLLGVWGLASTLLGVLGSWFLGLWVAPVVLVTKSDVPTNVLVHEQFDVEFEARNQHASAPCDIDFDPPTYQPVGGGEPPPTRTLRFPDPLRNFLPGERRVRVAGVIDGPGTFHVSLKAHAKAGGLRGKQSVEAYRVVRVWPAYEVSSVRRPRPVDAETCEVHCTLETGKDYPDGLKLVAFLTLVPGVKFNGVQFPEVVEIGQPKHKESQGAEMTMQEWKTPPLKAFREYRFGLVLHSKVADRQDWPDIAKKIRFR